MTMRLSRRRALQAGAAALPLVHISSGRAAGMGRGTQPAMLAGLFNGQSGPEVIAWAQVELEGFAR